MAKDPAFLFYPNDYLGGTMGMTFEEKGAYIELLMTQFNRGHMTSHMIGHIVGHIWDKIQDKFIQDENGLWYNKRLDEEKIKRQTYSDSRRNNKKGVNQYSKKEDKKNGHMTLHMIGHMENENENENIISNIDSKVNLEEKIYNSKANLFMDKQSLEANMIEETYLLQTVENTCKLTKEVARSKIKEFINVKALDLDKSYSENCKHFLNWVQKQQQEKKNEKNKVINGRILSNGFI